MKRSFILVSPGPVDGYPPVQYQARLLADAGHAVVLVTTPLFTETAAVSFAHPGVEIRVSLGSMFSKGRMASWWRFASELFRARRTVSREAIEIAFDPVGIFFSDIVPRRPRRRIAHLHELVEASELFLERRLIHSLCRYNFVIVPDISRARAMQFTFGLDELPLVLENYPLCAGEPLSVRTEREIFEVIYCGSLGLHQKLDDVIRSMPGWPPNARLVLIGNDRTRIAAKLRELAVKVGIQDRVNFLGWMETPDAERRISEANLGIALLDPELEQWRTALGASNKRYQIMKAGLPQIGDTNPGVRDLLEGNGLGACVADGDTHEIAALVEAYNADPARCKAEGGRAFALHQTEFNYEIVFKRLLERIAKL